MIGFLPAPARIAGDGVRDEEYQARRVARMAHHRGSVANDVQNDAQRRRKAAAVCRLRGHLACVFRVFRSFRVLVTG